MTAIWYVAKILAGSLIAWFGLGAAGIGHPYWAIITICIASDPDFRTARQLALARSLNTLVGGAVGLAGAIIGGLSATCMFVCLGLTTLLVTSLPRYPANWRLAPVTVVIIMEVSAVEAKTRAMEIRIAELRVVQVVAGCAITLAMAWIMSRWYRPQPPVPAPPRAPA